MQVMDRQWDRVLIAELDKRRLQVMDVLRVLFFYQEIAGHGPPMRHCNNGWLRQKEIAGFGPL